MVTRNPKFSVVDADGVAVVFNGLQIRSDIWAKIVKRWERPSFLGGLIFQETGITNTVCKMGWLAYSRNTKVASRTNYVIYIQ